MVAKTDPWKRFFDLLACVMELIRDGKRELEEVCLVLQAIKDGKKFKGAGVEAPIPSGADVDSQLASWQDLYLGLGIKVDITNLKIPAPQPGFMRLILVPEGMTPNKAVTLLKKKMQVYTYTDNLDTITSIRDTKKTYVIWVRDRQEADEELKNKSADDLKRDKVNCITLIERLLYELKFFSRPASISMRRTGRFVLARGTRVATSRACTGARTAAGSTCSGTMPTAGAAVCGVVR